MISRRSALKNMGLALGYAAATPAVVSILQSCNGESAPAWIPKFYTEDEGAVVKQLVDIIIPKTDIPSASEVNVHQFIDGYMDQVMELEQREFFKKAFSSFVNKALADSGKENMADLTEADLEPVLAASLKTSPETQEQLWEAIMTYQEAMAEGQSAELPEEAARLAFSDGLRGITVWAFKSSEQIGENVLAYLSVPGQYVPCDDVETLTGGKAWAI